MKICIVGAGAIGGMVAARIAKSERNVSVIARGANLEAIQQNGGVKLAWEDGAEIFGALRASDRPAELGPQDVVFLALKAHQLHPLLDQLPALFDEHTSVVTMQNGIPFWYFYRHGGEFEGRTVESVDPGGLLLKAIGGPRIIGSIVYPASELVEPGIVRHIEGNRFTLGEPNGSDSERARAIAGVLREAGFKAPITADIRGEIWLKLWGNLVFNPVSALTHAALEDICRYPLTRTLAQEAMREAQEIGEKLGVKFRVSIEKRIAGAEAIGAHKTSMLQDVEGGRALELDALVGSVVEMGRITQLPTPHIDTIYAIAKLLDKTLQDKKGRLRLGRPEGQARTVSETIVHRQFDPPSQRPSPAEADAKWPNGANFPDGVLMQPCNTLKELLSPSDLERPAIGAPGRSALTFAALADLIDATIRRLNDLGLGRNDRIAIVLPNGPEMATCFVAVASGATSAPLNPSYRAEEFEFYLNDLNAKLLIVMRGVNSPALDVATKLGIPVADLTPGRIAGEFVLEPRGTIARSGTPAQKGFAEADDVALVLHTSGTTSRPKIVPLTQQNVCASARHVCGTLAFTMADRGLNIMPLFHIHGLIAGLLAPLSAGSQVFCSPGFDALKFFSWMDECRPTWFTAVPTMHQAILTRAPRNADVIKRNPLRFLRSSSSSMPPQVIHQLETVFNAPLIEAYGMTEAAHQMATNPLPPGKRKPGTVGLPGGPDVEIMDEAGNLLPPNTVGEIVIRGPNVTPGYENNPKANTEAFVNSWFRTGDQGIKDSEGYISLTGRLKEIINRGGEKISPREVDEVIMDHPAVAQVVCFALPHPKLGEEVGAAVVLKEDAAATEREIREFVATRMADFKVPKKVLILAELPKGATGKLQRIGLAQKLGLA